MNTSELSDKVDELEIRRAEARSAVEMAAQAVRISSPPFNNNTAAWLAYEARVTLVVKLAAELDAIEAHLAAAAELEQAIKEGRWNDVATWAAKLATIEGVTAEAVTPQPERTPRMEMTWRLGKATDAERCATDLRNRGLLVAEARDGRTLTVEAPSGWAGTSPVDVAKVHGVERIETAEGVSSTVLYRRAKLTPCPGVPHRSLAGETTCVESGGIIGAAGQCEVHEGR